MSSDHSFTATQMYWKPELIRLTQIVHPDMDGGEPTTCFLDPQSILSVNRTMSGFSKETGDAHFYDPNLRQYHPRVACTCVMTTYGHSLMVTESPETVALLRDKAMGYGRKPKKV